jgi:hypothetical protein
VVDPSVERTYELLEDRFAYPGDQLGEEHAEEDEEGEV